MWSHTKRSRSRHTWNTRFDITSWRWWRWRQPPRPRCPTASWRWWWWRQPPRPRCPTASRRWWWRWKSSAAATVCAIFWQILAIIIVSHCVWIGLWRYSHGFQVPFLNKLLLLSFLSSVSFISSLLSHSHLLELYYG